MDAYSNHPSFYGTLNQSGNVAEWIEEAENGWCHALGGALIRGKYSVARGYQEGDAPDRPITSFGFRMARKVGGGVTAAVPSSAPAITAVIPKSDNGFVTVGDPGNEPDCFHGRYGRVDYVFEIARCELSNADYCQFLNAVAADRDPFGLWNPNMTTGILGGIDRENDGTGHLWRYVCKVGWAQKPVVYIGFYDLARYCNWLHSGRPVTKGTNLLGVTEGDARTGAYDTRDFEAVRSGRKAPYRDFGRRNADARYWIPSDDEWYKAAYYDPTRSGPRKYWDYPCRTDNPPGNHPDEVRSANYLHEGRLGVGRPDYLADVCSYTNAASYYGTLQQGGNVWEWIEGWQYRNKIGVRGLRGGAFGYTETGLTASNTDSGGLNDELNVFGGRIARLHEGHRVICRPSAVRRISWWLEGLGLRAAVAYGGLLVFGAFLVGLVVGPCLFRRTGTR